MAKSGMRRRAGLSSVLLLVLVCHLVLFQYETGINAKSVSPSKSAKSQPAEHDASEEPATDSGRESAGGSDEEAAEAAEADGGEDEKIVDPLNHDGKSRASQVEAAAEAGEKVAKEASAGSRDDLFDVEEKKEGNAPMVVLKIHPVDSEDDEEEVAGKPSAKPTLSPKMVKLVNDNKGTKDKRGNMVITIRPDQADMKKLNKTGEIVEATHTTNSSSSISNSSSSESTSSDSSSSSEESSGGIAFETTKLPTGSKSTAKPTAKGAEAKNKAPKGGSSTASPKAKPTTSHKPDQTGPHDSKKETKTTGAPGAKTTKEPGQGKTSAPPTKPSSGNPSKTHKHGEHKVETNNLEAANSTGAWEKKNEASTDAESLTSSKANTNSAVAFNSALGKKKPTSKRPTVASVSSTKRAKTRRPRTRRPRTRPPVAEWPIGNKLASSFGPTKMTTTTPTPRPPPKTSAKGEQNGSLTTGGPKPARPDCQCNYKEMKATDKMLAVVITKRGGFKGRRLNANAIASIMANKLTIEQMMDILSKKPISVSSNNTFVLPAGHYYFPQSIRFAGFESP